MVDIPHTAAGDAMLLGVATPTADSCVKDLGPSVQKISLVLSLFCCVLSPMLRWSDPGVFFAPSWSQLLLCGVVDILLFLFDKGTRTRLQCEVFVHHTLCYRAGRVTF